MTAEELAELRKECHGSKALAGYRVPVTLKRLSWNGATPMDLGRFRQHLPKLQTPGVKDPIQAAVSGSIRGDLTPVDASAVPVRFAPFHSGDKDVRQSILVESGSDVTRLELDRERTAEFLTVDENSLTPVGDDRGPQGLEPASAVGSRRRRGQVPPRRGRIPRQRRVRPAGVRGTARPDRRACLRIPAVGAADTDTHDARGAGVKEGPPRKP